MVSPELIGYIRSSRASGFDDDKIKSMLEQAGYPPDVVESAFTELAPAAPSVPTQNTPEPSTEQAAPQPTSTSHKDLGELPPGAFKRLIRLVFHPTDFFKQLAHEERAYRAFSQYLFIGAVSALIWFLLFLAADALAPDVVFAIFQTPDADSLFLAILLSIVVTLIVMPIALVIWHVFVMILGSKESYTRSLQIYMYGILPFLALSWFPFIQIAALLQAPYLFFKGLEELHHTSRVKAVLLSLLLVAWILLISVGTTFVAGNLVIDYLL